MGIKTKSIEGHSPEFKAYSKEVIAQIKEQRRDPIVASAVQCASMQATIDRDPSKDEEHFNRKLDLTKAIAPHPETIARRIDPFDFNMLERMRRKPKNSIGQSEKTAFTTERRERAGDAFLYTQPTKLTSAEMQKLTKLEPIVELESLPVEEKDSFFKGLFKKLSNPMEPDASMSYMEKQAYFDSIYKKDEHED